MKTHQYTPEELAAMVPTVNEVLLEAFSSNIGAGGLTHTDQGNMFYFLRGVLWGHCAAHGLSLYDAEPEAIAYIRLLVEGSPWYDENGNNPCTSGERF